MGEKFADQQMKGACEGATKHRRPSGVGSQDLASDVSFTDRLHPIVRCHDASVAVGDFPDGHDLTAPEPAR
jgi:hypothetical protein